MRESDDAAPLLTLMPWEWTAGKGKGSVGRELLWDSSPLDSSSMEDGLLSLPCMRFVAHRHCQYTLDKYFAGDYPGSKARTLTLTRTRTRTLTLTRTRTLTLTLTLSPTLTLTRSSPCRATVARSTTFP